MGNIMARDDILNQAILDLKPHCRKQLPVGTRVCIYWSNATGNCMFPGTIDTLDGLAEARLDMATLLLGLLFVWGRIGFGLHPASGTWTCAISVLVYPEHPFSRV